MGHSRKVPFLRTEIKGMWSKEGADKTILKSMSQSHFCDVMRKSSSSLKKLPLLLKVPLVRISSIENKKSETQLKWKELSFYWTCQKSKKCLQCLKITEKVSHFQIRFFFCTFLILLYSETFFNFFFKHCIAVIVVNIHIVNVGKGTLELKSGACREEPLEALLTLAKSVELGAPCKHVIKEFFRTEN